MSAGDFVGVPDPKLVFVGVANRDKFDKIGLPMTRPRPEGSRPVLTKSCEQDGVMIVFQHWLEWIRPEERVANGGSS